MKMKYEYTYKLGKIYSIHVWESKITKYIDVAGSLVFI